jgi:hypothetical protein
MQPAMQNGKLDVRVKNSYNRYKIGCPWRHRALLRPFGPPHSGIASVRQPGYLSEAATGGRSDCTCSVPIALTYISLFVFVPVPVTRVPWPRADIVQPDLLHAATTGPHLAG